MLTSHAQRFQVVRRVKVIFSVARRAPKQERYCTLDLAGRLGSNLGRTSSHASSCFGNCGLLSSVRGHRRTSIFCTYQAIIFLTQPDRGLPVVWAENFTRCSGAQLGCLWTLRAGLEFSAQGLAKFYAHGRAACVSTPAACFSQHH